MVFHFFFLSLSSKLLKQPLFVRPFPQLTSIELALSKIVRVFVWVREKEKGRGCLCRLLAHSLTRSTNSVLAFSTVAFHWRLIWRNASTFATQVAPFINRNVFSAPSSLFQSWLKILIFPSQSKSKSIFLLSLDSLVSWLSCVRMNSPMFSFLRDSVTSGWNSWGIKHTNRKWRQRSPTMRTRYVGSCFTVK